MSRRPQPWVLRYPGREHTYEIRGIPKDIGSARDLFARSPLDFERWAVSQVGAQPNEKQVGDKGVDGVARFQVDGKGTTGRMLVSVKGGKSVGPTAARDLDGTVRAQRAEMGVLITMGEPTRGVLDAVAHGGTYRWPVNGQVFPRLQVVTVPQLLAGKRPATPSLDPAYPLATRAPRVAIQETL